MDESDNIVISAQVIEFVTLADQLCKHLARAQGYQPEEFLRTMQKLLPFLYLKTIGLPKLEPVFEEGNEHFVDEDEYNMIEASLAGLLGPSNSFEEPYDNYLHESGEPAAGQISEYLADIYQHLKDFVLQYQTGTAEVMNDAIWECAMNFEIVWGLKLLSVLRAIHRILYSGKDPDEAFKYHSDDHHVEDEGKSSWFISRRQKEYGED